MYCAAYDKLLKSCQITPLDAVYLQAAASGWKEQIKSIYKIADKNAHHRLAEHKLMISKCLFCFVSLQKNPQNIKSILMYNQEKHHIFKALTAKYEVFLQITLIINYDQKKMCYIIFF